MDEHRIIDQLRAGAEGVGTEDSDLDALVAGAVVQGRRRRTRRRVGAALATVVAAAVVGTVLATGVVPTRLGSPQPVATPVLPSPVPSTTGPSPSPSVSASSPGTTGRLSGTPAQVQAALVGLLPGSVTVTRAVADSTASELGREHNAYLTLRDAAGTSNVQAGVGGGHYPDICATNDRCTQVSVGGGTLWTASSPPGDHVGLDQSAFFNRPDGGHVWLTQTNAVDGNGPVTRPGLPLTTAQVTRLMTSPAWDRFFQG